MQRIENEIKPGIFEEKRGIAALLFKNSRFYFVRAPMGCKWLDSGCNL